VENRPLIKFIGNNILDSSGVFSKILTSKDVDDAFHVQKILRKIFYNRDLMMRGQKS